MHLTIIHIYPPTSVVVVIIREIFKLCGRTTAARLATRLDYYILYCDAIGYSTRQQTRHIHIHTYATDDPDTCVWQHPKQKNSISLHDALASVHEFQTGCTTSSIDTMALKMPWATIRAVASSIFDKADRAVRRVGEGSAAAVGGVNGMEKQPTLAWWGGRGGTLARIVRGQGSNVTTIQPWTASTISYHY